MYVSGVILCGTAALICVIGGVFEFRRRRNGYNVFLNLVSGFGICTIIDIGIDNLAAVTTNAGYRTCIINGRGLKSVNKYYNQQMSHYREVAKRMNGMYFTKRMGKITAKRNWKINDYMHKASRKVVDFCRDKNIHTIVIGYNKDWKRESKLSKNVN